MKMETALRWPPGRHRSGGMADEIVSLMVGIVTTVALFMGIAHFKDSRTTKAPPAIEALLAVAIPPEPPPPTDTNRPEPVENALPFAGLDIAASESAVKITVLPPDLDSLVPNTHIPPTAVIQSGQIFRDLKPKIDPTADFQRVYQQTEVDRQPTRDVTPNPIISKSVRGDADTLRVRLLMIIDLNGRPTGVRITKSSGNAEFDVIIANCIQDGWIFTPAMKNGRKVKCLIEQPFTVRWSGGSRFGT